MAAVKSCNKNVEKASKLEEMLGCCIQTLLNLAFLIHAMKKLKCLSKKLYLENHWASRCFLQLKVSMQVCLVEKPHVYCNKKSHTKGRASYV